MCHEAPCFPHIISFNLHNNTVKWLLLYMIASHPKCCLGKKQDAQRWGHNSDWVGVDSGASLRKQRGLKHSTRQQVLSVYPAADMMQVYCFDTSLVGLWLRLCARPAGEPGSIPARGIRSHRRQLRVHMSQREIPSAANGELVQPNK